MIKIILISLAVFSVALLGMAVGFILSGRRLKGSCGGLSAVLGEDCLFCEKREECPERRKKIL